MPIDLSNSAQLGSSSAPGIKYRDKTATYERRVFRWTGPASYVTGGEAVNTLTTFGLGSVPVVHTNPARADGGTALRWARWDRTNKKMQWFDAAGNEIANGVDLSTFVFTGEALGY